MPESLVYNVDCLEYMETLPDKCFELAIVDPDYYQAAKKRIEQYLSQGDLFKEKDKVIFC